MGRLPAIADFPKKVKVDIVAPPRNDPATNALILLHGLGDKHASFTNLGQQMQLPETACISIRGPQGLLDLGGFHWGDDIIFDSTSGGLDADAGFKQSTEMLGKIVKDMLGERCGFAAREVMVLGFGQGGMAGLNLAAHLHEAEKYMELGGIISIGAGLPSDVSGSPNPKCKTPILVCAGSDQSAVTPATEDKLKRVFEFVEIKRYRKPGDSMPSNKDEMMPIMQFFSRRLRSTKGVPEGSVEVK